MSIDTKKIKSALSMETLLKHYNVEKQYTNQYWCVIHEKGGQGSGHKTPSLVLHPASQTVTCKSQNCFTGDDIFRVISKVENLDIKSDYPKIIKIAADIAGIQIGEIQTTEGAKPLKILKTCTPLTSEHITYLKGRGLKEETITLMNLKSSFDHIVFLYGTADEIIGCKAKTIIPKNQRENYKLNNPKWMSYFIKGSKPPFWSLGSISNKKIIYLVAGEYDLGILYQNIKEKGLEEEVAVISMIAGEADSIKSDTIKFFETFGNEEWRIVYDLDKTGLENMPLRAKELLETKKKVSIFKWEEEMNPGKKTGYDINDYFLEKGNIDIFLDEKNFQSIQTETEFKEPVRVAKIDNIEKEVSFTEWQEVIKSNFPELLFPAEIGLSIISQILIKDVTNPFALVLIDVPSAGKTIVINFFSDIDLLTYASDKFTTASFVSNASNVKKEKLKEIDLLPRLKYKMLLLRDLSTLFSKRDDELNECMGLLTRVLDGEGLNTDSGVHGQRQYVGEYLFMILAGSTPIQPKVWKIMGSLGSRLFFLNMGARDKSDQELAEQITTLAYKDKEKICRTATKNFLYTLWHKYPEGVVWDKTQDKIEEKLVIVQCARLLARLRGVISIWQESTYIETDEKKYSYQMPIIEKPDRINQLFYNLCRGHALVCGRDQINQEDLKLIVELAIDSCPTIRAKLFRELINNNGTMKTSDVVEALNCSRPTALKEMETLKILGVCHVTQESMGEVGEPEKKLRLSQKFQWFLSDECKRIRGITLAPEQVQSTLINNQ
jgi:hypothetical protein